MIDIILDEIGYAEKLFQNLMQNPEQRLDKKPSRDLLFLARYLGQEREMTQDEIYLTLTELMRTHYPEFNLNAWHGILEDFSKRSMERRLVCIPNIPVTEHELSRIRLLKGRPLQRLAFTLLCLARYRLLILKSNNGWIQYPYKDIFRLANITATIQEQCSMIKELISLHYLRMNNIVDNLSLQILYLDTLGASPVRLKITEFSNLGYEYMLYCGEPYIRCQRCNCLSKKTSYNNLYCKNCRPDIEKERSRLSMQKKRKKHIVN